MRTIKKLHPAEYAPIADLTTYRVLPTRSIDYLDPFLFLNHHGPQIYPPNNNGLPFGPHPHRGMETVTFILAGDIAHLDNAGHKSVISAGGVQWMTAGSGLIHAEVSSEEFKQSGGPLEILQLWINLPARSKMSTPFYKGLQKNEIPSLTLDEGRVEVNLVAGNWDRHFAAFESEIGVQLNTIHFKEKGTLSLQVPQDHNILFYVIGGSLMVNDVAVEQFFLAEFNHDSEYIHIFASQNSTLLFGHAKPLDEPVVSQGPFVMNTEKEIEEAYQDYRAGRFGSVQF